MRLCRARCKFAEAGPGAIGSDVGEAETGAAVGVRNLLEQAHRIRKDAVTACRKGGGGEEMLGEVRAPFDLEPKGLWATGAARHEPIDVVATGPGAEHREQSDVLADRCPVLRTAPGVGEHLAQQFGDRAATPDAFRLQLMSRSW